MRFLSLFVIGWPAASANSSSRAETEHPESVPRFCTRFALNPKVHARVDDRSAAGGLKQSVREKVGRQMKSCRFRGGADPPSLRAVLRIFIS